MTSREENGAGHLARPHCPPPNPHSVRSWFPFFSNFMAAASRAARMLILTNAGWGGTEPVNLDPVRVTMRGDADGTPGGRSDRPPILQVGRAKELAMSKVRACLSAGCVFVGLVAWSGPANGQDKKDAPPAAAGAKGAKPEGNQDKKPPTGEMSPEDMQKAMQSMMPGPMHAKMAKLAGDWNTKTKMAAPGQPPMEETGTSKITLVLDGRFVQEDAKGMMMGMPVTSHKLWGYNNGSKKFEAVWTYTMSTGMLTMKGTSGDDGKSIKWDGSFENELGIQESLHGTHKFVDDDTFVVELIGDTMPDGSEPPRMTTTYTRVKPGATPAGADTKK